MKAFSLNGFIRPNILSLIFMLIAYLAIWSTNILFLPGNEALQRALYDGNLTALYPLFGILVLIFINSFLIRRFVLQFSIVRTKSFLPIFFFLVFTLTWPELRTAVFPHFFLTVFLVCLDLLFSNYRNRTAVESAFLSSLLIAAASLVHPWLLVCIPILWLTLLVLKSMSVRMWLASLIGMAAPWLLYIAWHWWKNRTLGIAPEVLELKSVEWFFKTSSNICLAYIGLMSVIGLFCIVGLFNRLLDDSIQTRKYIQLLFIALLVLLVINSVYPQQAYLLWPIVASLLGLIMAHPFSLSKSPIYSTLFLIFGLLNIFYLLSQYLQINI